MQSLSESYGFRGDIIHVRPALKAWKNHLIDFLCYLLALARQYHASTRAAKSFMRCGCHHVESEIEWILSSFSSDQTRNVCDVHHGICTHFFGDVHELFVIKLSRIGRKSCENYFRFFFYRSAAHLLVIYLSGFRIFHFVADESEDFREIGYWVPVGEVTAM